MSKKRKSSQQVYMTNGDLNKIKRELTEDVFNRTEVLVIGYLMDDFDFDADRIVDFHEGLDRYCDALNDGVITLRNIADLITEKTGIRFRGVNA